MTIKDYTEIEPLYIPLINIKIGGRKTIHFKDGSEETIFMGLNNIVHKIKMSKEIIYTKLKNKTRRKKY
ncbi:MAG: hypothetical protein KAI57_02145 [Candidatus Pacebacteria bacterium]|nr:hypothetical protein [Candidatus Paceibacterota bacterium]